ncbi:MAG: GxxExxY protein [bacterium]
MDLLCKDLTDKIIWVFYKVYNELGFGFLEKVYENAMMIELRKNGLSCSRQQRVEVFYFGEQVGEYFADIIVNNSVILELKAAEFLAPEHEAQLINYLKGTNIEVGLLLNFGKKPEFKRKVFANERKKNPI